MQPKTTSNSQFRANWLSPPLVLSFCLFLLISFAGCPPEGNQNTDGKDPVDTLKGSALELGKEKFTNPIPDTEAGKALKAHLGAMTGHGEAAEERYQASLKKLKENPEMAKTVFEAYRKADEIDYEMRTLLSMVLKNLGDPESLEFQGEIARSPIPEDRFPKSPEFSTVRNEVVIRSFSVEGIGLIAAQGNKKADQMLEKLIDLEDITLRQLAVRGYLSSKGANVQRRTQMLQEKLPKDQHWMITTRLTDIKTVPHPEDMPEKFDLDQFKNTGKDSAPKTK